MVAVDTETGVAEVEGKKERAGDIDWGSKWGPQVDKTGGFTVVLTMGVNDMVDPDEIIKQARRKIPRVRSKAFGYTLGHHTDVDNIQLLRATKVSRFT